MLRQNAYDTICHEHLEYYSFKVIYDLLKGADLRIINLQLNTVNGGSLAVTACKVNAPYPNNQSLINWLLSQEEQLGLDTPKPYRVFEENVFRHRKNLSKLIMTLAGEGKKIFGYGASTKGNVLLQFCNFNSEHIPYIAEINADKFNAYTPGTFIPIIPEEEAKKMKPDYFLVLPWHFKHFILQKEKDYIENGGRFIFPLSLPEIEIF